MPHLALETCLGTFLRVWTWSTTLYKTRKLSWIWRLNFFQKIANWVKFRWPAPQNFSRFQAAERTTFCAAKISGWMAQCDVLNSLRRKQAKTFTQRRCFIYTEIVSGSDPMSAREVQTKLGRPFWFTVWWKDSAVTVKCQQVKPRNSSRIK